MAILITCTDRDEFLLHHLEKYPATPLPLQGNSSFNRLNFRGAAARQAKAEIIPDNLHRIMPAKGEKSPPGPYRPGFETVCTPRMFSTIFNDEEINDMYSAVRRIGSRICTNRKEIQ